MRLVTPPPLPSAGVWLSWKMEEFRELRVCFSTPGGSSSVHTIYSKRHAVRQSNARTPNGLTLFTLGWPPYCTNTCVEELFSRAGEVKRVYLQPSPGPAREEKGRGFQVGYIVFSSSEEVEGALGLCSASEPVPCPLHRPVGLGKWCADYMSVRTSVESLEASVEALVKEYDSRKEEESVRRKRAREPDEEGWVTVVRRQPRTQLTHQERKKRKKKELLNFYNFQQREAQREKIAKLRQAFEQDKKRVASMREKRKFKPF